MRKRIMCLALVVSCMMAGCAKQPQLKNKETKNIQHTIVEDDDFELKLTSMVDKKDCFVCGDPADGLLEYYSKFDSIGIIHWNDMTVVDTEVKSYDDNGVEQFNDEYTSIRTSSFGKGCGSITCVPQPIRGFTETDIHIGENDILDYKSLERMLCQDCLDNVAGFYEEQVNMGQKEHEGSTGYCLIDFTTGELYTLSDPMRGYSIRDYMVRYDIEKQRAGETVIDLLIFYAPERSK